MVLVAVLGHLCKQNDEEHHQNDNADGEVWTYEYGEVVVLHRSKLRITEIRTRCRIKRIELCLDEIHGNEHSEKRPHRIERLRQIEATCGCFVRTHGQNIWVT